MTAGWALPVVVFVIVNGAIGITTKLALAEIEWRQILLWASITDTALAPLLILIGGEEVVIGPGTGWALLGAVAAVGAFVVFFIALDRGDASRVVPVTAGYPLVTVILAAIVLSEELTPPKVLGT